jgi:hypothetical protein
VTISGRDLGQQSFWSVERPDRLEGDVLDPGSYKPDEGVGASSRDQAVYLFDEWAAELGRVDPDLPTGLDVQ